jgi:HlyD family secretion protein
MRGKSVLNITAAAFLLVSMAACSGLNENLASELSASGTISALSVNIAPEVSGKITSMMVSEGDEISQGDLLFSLDDELLQSQYNQADAAVKVAEAAAESAVDQLSAAQIQFEIASQVSHATLLDFRQSAWDKPAMDEFDRPAWYFTQSEEIKAAQAVVDEAETNLKGKQTELDKVLADVANGDFIQLEERLVQAQYALRAADLTLEVAKDADEKEQIEDNAQDQYDLALSDLESIQKEYDQALNSSAVDDVLEARAGVAVAQTRLDSARDLLSEVLVGDDSLQVQAASAAVKQAQSAETQARANLVQAEANRKTLEIQLGKTKVIAPVSGVVLLQNLEEGELVSAGSTVMKVGNIDEVKLTVYISEDQYGLVKLNQEAVVTVDSYPQKTYTGKVTYISNEAEFTPSNVQTVEGRKSTVFAIEITIPNPEHDLKSGMPADVNFILQ